MTLHRPKTRHLITCLIHTALLSGCSSLFTTEYSPPETLSAPAWQHGQTASKALQDDAWWLAFNDAELNALISRVITKNNNLAAAGLTLKRARLEAKLTEDAQFPALSASLNTDRSFNLKRGQKQVNANHSANLAVSYEADLWGKLASSTNAAEWEARATELDYENTAWSLVATTVRLYWTLAYANQRLALADANIAYGEETLRIAKARHAAGAVSGLDVIEAEQTLTSLKASKHTLLQTSVETRNALAILLDSPLAADLREPQSIEKITLPMINAGLPAELLGRRPDLKAAELRLRKTLATADATRLSYYPALSLTGSYGSTSTALADLLSNPAASLGIGLTLPFLQWNEMRLSTKIAKIDYESAVVNFRQTLYSAMADVENSLSARTQYAAQASLLTHALALAKESERRYEVQYRAGAVSVKSWLDAQKTRRDAEESLAANKFNQLNNCVTLALALGGKLPPTEANNPANR